MQNYRGDPYEREPLEYNQSSYDSPSHRPSPPPHHQSPAPYYDSSPRPNHPGSHPDSAYNRVNQPQPPSPSYRQQEHHQQDYQQQEYHQQQGYHQPPQHDYRSTSPYDSPRRGSPNQPYASEGGYYPRGAPAPGQRGYAQHYPSHGQSTPGADNFAETASGGMAAIAYNVANRNPRYSGMDPVHSTGQVPPPPSRSQYPPQSNGGYAAYDDGYGHDSHSADSHSSHNGYNSRAVPPGGQSSPYGGGQSAYGSQTHQDPYVDNPYPGYSTRPGPSLGVVNPNEIMDDGDDGLNYHRSQRNSMLSLPHSDRGARRAAAGTTAAAAGAGAAAGGLLSSHGNVGAEKADYSSKPKNSKKWKWCIIILVFLVIIGAIVGGVVGGMMNNNKSNGKSGGSGSGESAKDDQAKNGDLDINSAEIKDLLNNPDLHRIFPGMDYTPLNTQYPACVHDPPSQNNITRDVAVLSQLTNKIRLYGTDCNQTEMLLHAIDKLDMKNDIKVWLGVWQDGNETTNKRQLDQMWTILDDYGEEPFEGIIVANEILFREEMTEIELASVLSDVRKELKQKKINLPVATSDLGDDWTAELAADSDLIMANIHPFFAGVTAKEAAAWTMNFWETRNKQFWKTDKKLNIISETGWPSSGGKNCGEATTCAEGSVAGIEQMNTFMDTWVCQALKNGTQYFWFEAFDEPWKEKFNTKGKAWEDQWGLMTVNRELKKGVKIPDCDGKTVS